MNQENLIKEVNKVADIRILLLNHPDTEMVKQSCLHYLGDAAQAWYNKTQIPITWKDVFNSNTADHYIWYTMDHARQAAKNAGYKYFTWNTLVYSVETCLTVETKNRIAITTDDLDGK